MIRKPPDPLVIAWRGRMLRIRHDDHRIGPYTQVGQGIRAAVELASDVEGLRLVLGSALGERYVVRVADDGGTVGLWRRLTARPAPDSELDALAAQLEAAGYLTVTTLPDGSVEYQLTPEGARVARQLAMSDEAGQDALLEALLDVADAATWESTRPGFAE